MRSASDISIVGAGLLGSALALYLAKHSNFKITLIERAPPLAEPTVANQRVLALGEVAAQFLSDISVFTLLNESSCHPYTRMCVWDENSTGQVNFCADELDKDQLGWMVDAQVLSFVLQQAVLETPSIEARFECTLTELKWQQEKCLPSKKDSQLNYLDSKGESHTLQSSLLIGADGGQSWLRDAAQIFSNRFSYQQNGIVALIETSKEHGNCAWQRFLGSGPVALLPVARGLSSIVWSTDVEYSQELMAMANTEFEQVLEQAIESRLGTVSLRSERQAFPLSSSRASRYHKNTMVLVGDAAHSIHPLAGQGANLGFKDIDCLAKLLIKNDRSQLGDPNTLTRYQRIRQKDNQQTDSLMTGLNRAYANQHPLWTPLRGFGMNLIDQTNSMRRILALQAIGS